MPPALPLPPPGSVVDGEGRTHPPSQYERGDRVGEGGAVVVAVRGRGKGLYTGACGAEGGAVVVVEDGVVIPAAYRVRPGPLAARGDFVAAVAGLEAHGQDIGTEAGLLEVLNTNAFLLPAAGDEDPAAPPSGMFPTIARANHSCVPNACVALTRPGGAARAVLRAMDAIPPHTEVTISYNRLRHGWCTASRRAGLLEAKGFYCKCPLCADAYDVMVDGPPVALPSLVGVAGAAAAPQPPALPPRQVQQLYSFILSHGDDAANESRSLEEYLAGAWVVGRLAGYRHWGVAYIARGLMLNAAAAAGAGDAAWGAALAALLEYFSAWGVKVFDGGRRCPDWYVELVHHGAAVLEQARPGHPAVAVAYHLVAPAHTRLFTAAHPDSAAMHALLAARPPSAAALRASKEYDFGEGTRRLGDGVAAEGVVAKHADRLMMRKFPGWRQRV